MSLLCYNLIVLSQRSYLARFWLSCHLIPATVFFLDCLLHLPCPGECPVPALLSQLSCPCCHVPTLLLSVCPAVERNDNIDAKLCETMRKNLKQNEAKCFKNHAKCFNNHAKCFNYHTKCILFALGKPKKKITPKLRMRNGSALILDNKGGKNVLSGPIFCWRLQL